MRGGNKEEGKQLSQCFINISDNMSEEIKQIWSFPYISSSRRIKCSKLQTTIDVWEYITCVRSKGLVLMCLLRITIQTIAVGH